MGLSDSLHAALSSRAHTLFGRSDAFWGGSDDLAKTGWAKKLTSRKFGPAGKKAKSEQNVELNGPGALFALNYLPVVDALVIQLFARFFRVFGLLPQIPPLELMALRSRSVRHFRQIEGSDIYVRSRAKSRLECSEMELA